jgi:hypothetical protein
MLSLIEIQPASGAAQRQVPVAPHATSFNACQLVRCREPSGWEMAVGALRCYEQTCELPRRPLIVASPCPRTGGHARLTNRLAPRGRPTILPDTSTNGFPPNAKLTCNFAEIVRSNLMLDFDLLPSILHQDVAYTFNDSLFFNRTVHLHSKVCAHSDFKN